MVGTQVILLKTRVPEAPLSGYLSLLGSIFGLAALGMFVNVVIQMYRNWSKAWAIVSIFVPVLAFVWGWSRVSKLPLGRTMIVWTATMVLAGGLFYLSAVAGASVVPGVSIPLGVALWGVLGSLVTGAVLGLNASYRGGWWDQAIMQLSDALIAFPRIVLFLVVIAALGQGDLVVIVAITVTGAPGVARLVRSLGFDIKTRDYVRAAETRGENAGWIMYREILPNARGPILIDSMLRVGYAIFAIGTLGFLGIGLPPPDPDWGNMVNEARRNIFNNPWGVVWPAVAIATLVIGLNLLADGLREELTRFQK
ncbi:MAG: ABC transporter permease [Caldilineaceae bacterium]|nr:ABC transporter permease [Caldilineaceae bacterium]